MCRCVGVGIMCMRHEDNAFPELCKSILAFSDIKPQPLKNLKFLIIIRCIYLKCVILQTNLARKRCNAINGRAVNYVAKQFI